MKTGSYSTRPARYCLAVAVFILASYANPKPAQAQHGVRRGADSVKVNIVAAEMSDPADAAAYGRFTIHVQLDHADGFHTWPHEPVVPEEFRGVTPIATSLEVESAPDGVVLHDIEWPEPVEVTVLYTGSPVPLLAYAESSEVVARFNLSRQVNVSDTIELVVQFQACDEEICYPPRAVSLVTPLQKKPRHR